MRHCILHDYGTSSLRWQLVLAQQERERDRERKGNLCRHSAGQHHIISGFNWLRELNVHCGFTESYSPLLYVLILQVFARKRRKPVELEQIERYWRLTSKIYWNILCSLGIILISIQQLYLCRISNLLWWTEPRWNSVLVRALSSSNNLSAMELSFLYHPLR